MKNKAFRYDPALKLVVLTLLIESEKNDKISPPAVQWLKDYLLMCHQHEQAIGLRRKKAA